MGTNSYLLRVVLTATLGGLLFGYDTAVISGTVGALEEFFVKPMNLVEFQANSVLGFLVSSALLGCILGGFLAGYLSGRFGRKKALLFSAVLFLISAAGSAWPDALTGSQFGTTTLFIAFRIVGGVGVGIASMVSPLYISEIVPAQLRGRLVSLNQLAIIFGMLLVYFVNYAIASGASVDWINSVGWRWMFLSEAVPALLFFFLLFGVPESPRWLVLKSRLSEAKQILHSIHPAERVDQLVEDIQQSLRFGGKARLLSFGYLVVLIGILLSVFQQFIGINVVLYYAPEIFKNLGSSSDSAMVQTIIVGAINFAFTFLAIKTVDRLGRKPLMVVGAFVMGAAMMALGTSFYLEARGIGSLLFMLLYIAGFAFSWGPVTWVLLSELFPNRIRSAAMGIAVAVQWAANYLVSATFPLLDKSTYLTERFHHGFAYWIYGLMALVAGLFVWRLIPETKGKSLEEIEAFWK